MPFDLRADVAEVPRKQGFEHFTLNLKLAREVKELRAAEVVDEATLLAKEAELDASTYTVEFASVPRRRREDIYEESLEKFPPKPSLFANHVDEGTQFKRNNFVRIALVAAAAQAIEKNGERLDDPAAIFDAIEFLHNEAPDQVFARLETKVNEINAEEDEQDALNKSADF
jgi:hypothetical protein